MIRKVLLFHEVATRSLENLRVMDYNIKTIVGTRKLEDG